MAGNDDIIEADGSVRHLPPCSYAHYDGDGNPISGPLPRPARVGSAAAGLGTTGAQHEINGWVVDFNWVFGNVTWFSNEFVVPPNPHSSEGQDIALFEGLEVAIAPDEIIQPVLDWGDCSDSGQC